MTKKERVARAVSHMETDSTPYSVSFTLPAYEAMQSFCRNPDFYDTLGSHICMHGYSISREVKPGYIEDQFGVVWDRSGADKDIGIVANKVIGEPSLKGFALPPIDEKSIRRHIEDGLRSNKDKYNIYCIGFCMFERAWSLCGMEDLLMYMVLEPSFVHELLDLIAEYNLGLLNIVLEYDLDCIHFGDDWGQQKGMIMGPTHWRTFILPRMKMLYQAVKAKGKTVSQHSCGDIHEVFPDLIDAGLDIYQTFQPEIYDVVRMKKEYGNHLTFWGHIHPTPFAVCHAQRGIRRVLPHDRTPVGERRIYSRPTHDVPADVPLRISWLCSKP